MTTVVETDRRPVLVSPLTELGKRTGSLMAALTSGALIRLDDGRSRRVAGLIVPPQDVPAVLAFLGIAAEELPEPGEARDAV